MTIKLNHTHCTPIGRRGGLTVSALDSREQAVRYEPWLGTLCCVNEQDTLLSKRLSPPMHG